MTPSQPSLNEQRRRARRAQRPPRPQSIVLRDYVGTPPAQAADDVRRDGLKPGVVPIEGEQLGVVISQDPQPGKHVTRNDVITLYVGAPAKLFPDDPATTDAATASATRTEPNQASHGPRGARTTTRAAVAQVRRVGAEPDPPGSRAEADEPASAWSPSAPEAGTWRATSPDAGGDGRRARYGHETPDDDSAARERVHEGVLAATGGRSAPERPSVAAGCPHDKGRVQLPGVGRRTAWRRWRALPGLARLATVLAALCALTAAAGQVVGAQPPDQVAAASRMADPPRAAVPAAAPSVAPRSPRQRPHSARRRLRRRESTHARGHVPVRPTADTSGAAAPSRVRPASAAPHAAGPAQPEAATRSTPPPPPPPPPGGGGGQIAGGPFSP